eukprot:8322674-Prorocentrum_lima.AAC.1
MPQSGSSTVSTRRSSTDVAGRRVLEHPEPPRQHGRPNLQMAPTHPSSTLSHTMGPFRRIPDMCTAEDAIC